MWQVGACQFWYPVSHFALKRLRIWRLLPQSILKRVGVGSGSSSALRSFFLEFPKQYLASNSGKLTFAALLFAPAMDFAYPLFIPSFPSGSHRTTRGTTRPIFRLLYTISVVAGCGFGCFDRLALFLHSLPPGSTVVAGSQLLSRVLRAALCHIRALAKPFPPCPSVSNSVLMGATHCGRRAFRAHSRSDWR